MLWTLVFAVLAAAHGGGGVTKSSGITQFWTDDAKVFDQIYGKTSDKDLYGATLPPSFGYGIDLTKLNLRASDKKERVIENDADFVDFQTDSYNDQLSKQSLTSYLKDVKPTKSFNFIPYAEFKPISQSNDPETYNYLKHLELQQIVDFPNKGLAGFKPYLRYPDVRPVNPKETDAYKSIQDILDAHEANKSKKQKNKHIEQDDIQRPKVTSTKRKQIPRYIQNNNLARSRCVTGKCRKRISSLRVRPRPVITRIKHKIVSK